MTREEEILFKQQVKNETISRKDELIDAAKRNAAIVSEFIKGAEWADQHPRKGLWDTEKVCEWLKENAWLYDIVQVHCVQTNIDDIIHDLRKAMEE